MTKADIIDQIARGTGLTKIETEAVVNGFIASLKQAMLAGERVEIRGFGVFQVQKRAARTARNPRTNEVVPVAPRQVPTFKPSRDLTQQVDAARKQADSGKDA